jgi:acyl-CoA thioester hydrolase
MNIRRSIIWQKVFIGDGQRVSSNTKLGLDKGMAIHRSEVEIRVRYSETDKMGYCYYGNYAQYFEVGRVEGLRELGVSYKELEDKGIGLPVKHFEIDYKRPARYDDKLKVVTVITDCTATRLEFDYEVYDQEAHLLCTASTTLVFVDLTTGRPVKAPEEVMAVLQP